MLKFTLGVGSLLRNGSLLQICVSLESLWNNLWCFGAFLIINPFAKLFIVDCSVTALIIMLKDHLNVIFRRVRREHYSQFLNGSFKLVQSHTAFVLDVKEFECLLQENRLLCRRRTFLIELLLDIFFETTKKFYELELVTSWALSWIFCPLLSL